VNAPLIRAEALRDFCLIMQQDIDLMLNEFLMGHPADETGRPAEPFFLGFAEGVAAVTNMLRGAAETASGRADELRGGGS